MTASEDSRLQVLYDHYKTSLETHRRFLWTRMAILISIFGVLALMVGGSIDPKNVPSLLSAVGGLAGVPDSAADFFRITPALLNSLLWFALGTLVVQLFHRSLFIEWNAFYLRDLEAQLEPFLGKPGIYYRRRTEDRPKLLKVANYFYLFNFVLLLIIVTVPSIYRELRAGLEDPSLRAFVAFDLFVFLAFIVSSSVLFVSGYRQLLRAQARSSESKGGVTAGEPSRSA